MSAPGHASDYADRIKQKLERELGDPVIGALRDASVIEIMLNPDGGLWVERFGCPMARLGEMPPHQAEAAMATLAAIHRTTITRQSPILECELPDGSRFEGLIPPVVAGPSFCIRKRASRIFTLDDYVAAGAMTLSQRELIREAALDHQNILIVGGTGSGKTTLVNAVIHLIAEELPHEGRARRRDRFRGRRDEHREQEHRPHPEHAGRDVHDPEHQHVRTVREHRTSSESDSP